MKKYLAPEMEMMDFIVDKSIAGSIFSADDDIYNDADHGDYWPKD